MPSQLELLREALAKLEADGGKPDNPMVQGLRAQIAMHERNDTRAAHGGFFDEKGKLKPQYMNPMD